MLFGDQKKCETKEEGASGVRMLGEETKLMLVATKVNVVHTCGRRKAKPGHTCEAWNHPLYAKMDSWGNYIMSYGHSM